MTTMREFEREVDESLYQQRLARDRDYSLQQKADIDHYIDPKYIKKDAYAYDINPDLKEFEDLPKEKYNSSTIKDYIQILNEHAGEFVQFVDLQAANLQVILDTINRILKETDPPEVKHNFESLISYRNSIEILMQSLQEVSHDFNKRISDSKAIFKNEENGNGDFYSTK